MSILGLLLEVQVRKYAIDVEISQKFKRYEFSLVIKLNNEPGKNFLKKIRELCLKLNYDMRRFEFVVKCIVNKSTIKHPVS